MSLRFFESIDKQCLDSLFSVSSKYEEKPFSYEHLKNCIDKMRSLNPSPRILRLCCTVMFIDGLEKRFGKVDFEGGVVGLLNSIPVERMPFPGTCGVCVMSDGTYGIVGDKKIGENIIRYINGGCLMRTEHFYHPNTTLILGPPGTGKTTQLHKIFKMECARGVPKNRIAMLSFTKQANQETQLRLNEDIKSVPWVKTIHSLTYNVLGLNYNNIFNSRHYEIFGSKMGLVVQKHSSQNPLSKHNKGTVMLFIHNLSGIKVKPLREIWQDYAPDDITWTEQKFFSDSYEKYKQEHQLFDFTDVLKAFLDAPIPLELDTVIVDEAQDLSNLQWRLISKMSKRAKKVYIAGDDDQSIFKWAGADIETFLNLDVRVKKVLDTSWRIPKTVHDLAETLVEQIEERYEKDYYPKLEKGFISKVSHFESLFQHIYEGGNWLILARDKTNLKKLQDEFFSTCIPFSSKLNSPLETSYGKAVKAYINFIKEGEIKYKNYKLLNKCNPDIFKLEYFGKDKPKNNDVVSLKKFQMTRTGFSTYWDKDLKGATPDHVAWLKSCYRKYGSTMFNPRITFSTIHSIKGAECENVVVCLDMTKKNYHNYENDPDNEHRVFYVAVTRTKETLFVLEPRTSTHYQLPPEALKMLGGN